MLLGIIGFIAFLILVGVLCAMFIVVNLRLNPSRRSRRYALRAADRMSALHDHLFAYWDAPTYAD